MRNRGFRISGKPSLWRRTKRGLALRGNLRFP